MIEQLSRPSETSSQDTSPSTSDEGHKRKGAPFGLLATCVILAVAVVSLGVMISKRNATVTAVNAQLDKANTATTQAKADLSRANDRADELQQQLDAAKNQSSDLQAQLKKAKGQGADLQARLDKATSHGSDLQTQLDQAQANSTESQTQLAKAKEAASGMRKELDQARSQTEDLKAQLTKAQGEIAKMQPLAAKARALPVATTFEKSFWSSGATLHVKNLSSQPLKVEISLAGAANAASKTATIAGGATLDVQDLAAGAHVVIASDGFDPANLTVR